MKKIFLSVLLTITLLVSLPFSAFANDSTTGLAASQETNVTIEDFLEEAVTALTFQHASDYMRTEVIENWLGDYEFENTSNYITEKQAALILVKALGAETNEETLDDYRKTAEKLGFFKGVSDLQPITKAKVYKMFSNVKDYQNKDIDNTGVQEISVEDFMRNPGSLGYQLSPDGEYIAYAAEWQSRLNVFIKNMDDESEPVRVTSTTDRDIAGLFWKDNNMYYLKDNGGDENYHIYSSSFNGAKEKDLTPYPNVVVLPIDYLKDVEDEILIMMNKEDATVFDVYKLNVKTGATKLVAKNPGNILSWIPDSNGQIRMAVASDGVVGAVLYRETEEDEFQPFISIDAGETVSPLGFSRDNQSIYAVSDKGRDKAALVKYDLEGKEEVVFSNPLVDISGALYSSTKDQLLYAAYITDKVHYNFFDSEFENLFNKMKDQLGVSASEFGINDYNKEMTKFIVSVSSDTVYGKYYYYDAETETMTLLAELGSWLDAGNLAEMHSISYEARDGLIIHGYLTLPKNKIAEDLPLVVIPHGGPWARDMWGFNNEVQLLANQGYAVLQANFRSSTGYGKGFLEAGNKQWGLKIQDDITDGVQWAIDLGIADAEKIGIYGASFGGYATLAGITFTPDLYAAAVDYVGVSNIFTLLETIPPYWETQRNMFYERVGHPEKDKELLKAASPVFHVDKIKTPLFVAQGANDPRVNKQESDQIVQALKNRGVEVEYMVKDNEGHGFANEENRIEFYNALVDFFAEYLK
ncbi:dipeptidyl aminopeptidase/acylaminoacyl-peptidase [Solibacillus silvestris StLB046]|uniref:Dipeptidyl aminopeptidase/acylaminoacyl-peptidase n=1 Tax=Solibacillus silvestris (strain StLB046) TaxID=1002809 RepID=F2F8L7_SOLSS|nr:S9 family peptidase [Solibacillus silvestris]BAK14958.1 dipeptidyl aminopeptidase/acylaminoacyl-peptidase [Solibacillus silvestris StLB046]